VTLYRTLAIVVSAFALALIAGLAWFVRDTPGAVFTEESERRITPIPTGTTPVTINVDQGDSAHQIGDRLQQAGVVRSARLFEVLVGIIGVSNSLEAGQYEFDAGLPAIEVVHRIAEGKTASRTIVVPEGRRVEEVAEIVEKAGLASKQEFLAALVKSDYDEPFLRQVPANSLEGYLFPARYEFARNSTAHQIVDTMLRAFQDNVADKVQLEGQDLSFDETVTLASIVEREAQAPEERPLIASVFLNRLRLALPLQADPTVQYAIARDGNASVAQYGWWKKELTVDDLKFESPYNTYVDSGLPPGPIANPGLDAIRAVVRPASTNYLFFVAKNDGTHVFAETLEEHLRNVERYQGH
jgi:UPF0755 protein